MKGISAMLVACLTACSTAGTGGDSPASAANESSAASIEGALPAGRSPLHVYTGDLDRDGDRDALVTTLPMPLNDAAAPRGIVLLRRDGDSWRVVARNDRAVLCETCGGAMGDPLAGIEMAPGGFVLRFEGGSRTLWSVAYRFGYAPTERRWMLEAVDRKGLDRVTGNARTSHAGPADTGRLDFTDFDPADETLAPLD